MYDLNKVILIGRITADIELKETQSGKAYCNLSIACTMSKNKETGNSVTEFINCTAWEKSAEILAKYATKGDLVYIEGALNTTSKDDNGKKTYYTKVIVKDFKLLSSKSDHKSMSQTAQSLDLDLEDIDSPF
jgi:single-strand DNA-binding protein